MKTIYNLEVGDIYYIKRIGKVRTKMISDVSMQEYKDCVNCGIAFLTKEECQRSIDYDVALAKIKRRASELGNNSEELLGGGRIYKDSLSGKLDVMGIYDYGWKLEFSEEEIAEQILKELPEECKTVLGVQQNGK